MTKFLTGEREKENERKKQTGKKINDGFSVIFVSTSWNEVCR